MFPKPRQRDVLKSGLLKQRTVDSVGAGTMEVMGQSIPMKSKITGTITVNGF